MIHGRHRLEQSKKLSMDREGDISCDGEANA